MAGRRLLDLSALFNASRGIALRHVALRQQQLDVFLRTSSLAKAAKAQTDRLTETAKAASMLASRMNEDRPAWTKEATDTEPAPSKPQGPIPTPSATTAEPAPKTSREGLQQDHHYEASKSNAAAEPIPKGELHVHEAKADSVPTPDGSIPPQDTNAGIPLKHQHANHDYKLSSNEAKVLQREYESQIPSKVADGAEGHAGDTIAKDINEDSFYHRSEHISPTLSSLPRSKLPKRTSAEQADDAHVASPNIHPDTFTAPVSQKDETPIPARPADGAEGHAGDEIVKEIDTSSFYHASKHTSTPTSAEPSVELPAHTNAVQGDDIHVASRRIKSDTFTAPIPERDAITASPSAAATSEVSAKQGTNKT